MKKFKLSKKGSSNIKEISMFVIFTASVISLSISSANASSDILAEKELNDLAHVEVLQSKALQNKVNKKVSF